MGRRIAKFIPLLFMVLSAILFQSCPNSLAEIIEDDITVYKAPSVLTTIPSPGAKDVFIDTAIQIKLDKDLDESSVNASSITVKDDSGNPVSGTIEYNNSSKTIYFYAASTYDTDSDYFVTLTKNVKSSDGNPLLSDYKWKFTTGISTSLPGGTISAVSETNEDTVTLNFTRDNLYVTKMTVYVESPSVSKTTIGELGRAFQPEVVYTHSITSGNDENYTFSVIFHNDNFNNSSENSLNVYIDRNPPDSPAVSGQSITSDTTPTWSWAAVSEAVSYRYSYNNSTWTVLGNTTSFTSAALSDGTYTLYVQAMDSAGNWSASGSKTTEVNSTSTAPSVYISGNPSTTADSTPTWQWNAVSGAVNYRYKLDSSTLTTGATETTLLSYTPGSALSDGSHTLYVQSQNNASVWSSSGSYAVTVDTTAPVFTSFNIQNSAAYTTSTSVTLYSSVANVYQMRFSNNNSTWSSWETYKSSKSWTLASGDGTKTVYAQYRDSVYNTTSTKYDTIILDTTTPVVSSCLINNNATYTTSTSVTLNMSVTGADLMRFYTSSWSSWETYSSSKSLTLPSGDAEKKVYFQFKDNAGHETSAYSDTIILDSTAPSAPTSLAVNTTSSYLYETAPKISWASSGSDNLSGVSGTFVESLRRYVSVSGIYMWTTLWTKTGTSTSRYLTGLSDGYLPDGSFRYYVQEKDNAGNTSSSAYTSFTVNTSDHGTSPGNGEETSGSSITFSWPYVKGYTYKLYIALDPTNFSSTAAYTGTSTSYTVTAPTGTNIIYWKVMGSYLTSTVYSPVYQFIHTR